MAGDVRLYPWLTTRRALRIVESIRKRDLREEGERLAGRFQLEPDLPVRKMSRGNRQKVALVMALAHKPKLVILDEPTSGLDPLMQDTLADCLQELARNGHTVFFSSRTLSEVESLCDRVAIIRDGHLVTDQKLSDLKAQSPRNVVLTFDSAAAAAACVAPDDVEVSCVDGETMTLTINGPAVALAKWASTQSIADLSIGQPNLEALFRSYYQPQPTAEGTA